MAGRGPAPKPATERRTRHKPTRGEWQDTPGRGWLFGPVPDPPDGLCPAAIETWGAWMGSWFAAKWVQADLPGLRHVIQLFDQCERFFDDPYIEKETRKGDSVWVLRPNPAGELRQSMDGYGVTPKGQQDRRWAPPKADETPKGTEAPIDDSASPYGHLRAVPNSSKARTKAS